MQMLLIWFVAYVAPAGIAGISMHLLSHRSATRKYIMVVIHAFLGLSIFMSQYVIRAMNLSFPWSLGFWSVLSIVAAAVITTLFLGRLGPMYLASAFIQQLTMLSIAFILLSALPVYAVILLIMPIFVIAHFISADHWQARMALLSLWGIASILLFQVTNNIYAITALHAVLGSLLVSKSVLPFDLGGHKKAPAGGWLR